MKYEELEKELNAIPKTFIPALFLVLIRRSIQDNVFAGLVGLMSFVKKTYEKELKKILES